MKTLTLILFLIIPFLTFSQVEPLVKTRWTQKCYYNDACPVNPDGPCGHAVVGCVGLAVAQIIRYWQFPQGYDYANMPDKLSAASRLSEINATSWLLYDVSFKLGTVYGAKSSYSGNFRERLIAMGYSKNLQYAYADDMSSYEFELLIRTELNFHRPVLVCGFDFEFMSYHQFIIDGYNGDRFHALFGWEGEYWNGYYRLDEIPFWVGMQIMINVYPDNYNALTVGVPEIKKETIKSKVVYNLIGQRVR